MSDSELSCKRDISDFDIGLSSDEEDDFINNSDRIWETEANSASTATNIQHDNVEQEEDVVGFQLTRSEIHQYKSDMKGSFALKYNRYQKYRGGMPYKKQLRS